MARLVEAVYFDSDVWIRALEQEGPVADNCRDCIKCVEQYSLVVVLSTILPMEVLGHNLEELVSSCGPRRAKPRSVDPKVIELASLNRRIFQVKRNTDSKTPKSPKPLNLGDSIHLATAAVENCRSFVAVDGDYDTHADFAKREFNMEILKPEKFLERYGFQRSLLED